MSNSRFLRKIKIKKTNCLPAKIRYQNQEIIIKQLALDHPTKAGQRTIHVFDVSDGQNDYRLEFDTNFPRY